ncbi:N, N'-diacetylbacillosaminyl-diphospho-undecaprenol alpha-1,3-N-acetylgalactosaminyltransferase [Campylobacter majalis]|uniref:N, N'-diacetylbacillosaminyl-diphospho-undecaprenol alpha-1,3-N-acetylgalactosaminyltransferase n=1 Tax=Campylobacter majalis TaxID=2790656 RepID=A0ABN7KAD9_9BACT|nr:glycosyltransferase [Campylobacter majalis]CAD7289445.1 N, N'-diacetylbacillosaminyl-diphospho-undecaprenol alpha-1,3-N-acetylgalactosaminyltransferase [Campylobacter majalis]
MFLNKDDKNDLINAYGIKTKQIYILGGIGVDLTKFSYQIAPINPVSFIFVARLLAEKGIFEYIQAAKAIKEKYKYVKFYVLGSFDENNPFSIKKDEIAKHVAAGAIEFIGFVKNVKEYIANSSVFVLPSYYKEGVPRSTQEAMAIGRAVITTNSVGCKETVEDGVNGFLVPPCDSEILAEKNDIFYTKS